MFDKNTLLAQECGIRGGVVKIITIIDESAAKKGFAARLFCKEEPVGSCYSTVLGQDLSREPNAGIFEEGMMAAG